MCTQNTATSSLRNQDLDKGCAGRAAPQRTERCKRRENINPASPERKTSTLPHDVSVGNKKGDVSQFRVRSRSDSALNFTAQYNVSEVIDLGFIVQSGL